MPTTSPSAAMHSALATYLGTAIAAEAGLSDSICLTRWPEPTYPLELTETRVVLALERTGAPDDDGRIGPPVRSRYDITPSGSATARFDYGQVEQSFTLHAWCVSDAIRDDVDDILHRLLNQPYAATVAPVVNTVAAYAIAAGTVDVIPASMADIWPNTRLCVGTSETVIVESTTATTFRATFLSAHSAGTTLVETNALPIPTTATGLRLRAPLHHNAIARFDFDQPRWFDDLGADRQEWRSVRTGVGMIAQLRDFAVVPQESLTLSVDGKSRPIF